MAIAGSPVSVLPGAGAAFDDVRDGGRTMRVAWHQADGFFVFSMWREGVCVATSRLDRYTSAELVTTLVAHLASE